MIRVSVDLYYCGNDTTKYSCINISQTAHMSKRYVKNDLKMS